MKTFSRLRVRDLDADDGLARDRRQDAHDARAQRHREVVGEVDDAVHLDARRRLELEGGDDRARAGPRRPCPRRRSRRASSRGCASWRAAPPRRSAAVVSTGASRKREGRQPVGDPRRRAPPASRARFGLAFARLGLALRLADDRRAAPPSPRACRPACRLARLAARARFDHVHERMGFAPRVSGDGARWRSVAGEPRHAPHHAGARRAGRRHARRRSAPAGEDAPVVSTTRPRAATTITSRPRRAEEARAARCAEEAAEPAAAARRRLARPRTRPRERRDADTSSSTAPPMPRAAEVRPPPHEGDTATSASVDREEVRRERRRRCSSSVGEHMADAVRRGCSRGRPARTRKLSAR